MTENNRLSGLKRLALPKSDNAESDLSFISSYKEVQSSKLVYYIWLSRFFIFLAVLSLSFLVASTLVIFNLAPQIQVEPFLLISQNSSQGIVRNEAISSDMASKEQLMETFVKQYVIARNTVVDDEREMATRWYPGGMINMLSSNNVFSSFNKYREAVWQILRDTNLSREIEITSIGRVGGEKSNIWKIDFKTYDLTNQRRDPKTKAVIITTRYWTASLTAYYIPAREFMGLRLINPLGFTVVRYSQREVEII